jgi:hypothetical protein
MLPLSNEDSMASLHSGRLTGYSEAIPVQKSSSRRSPLISPKPVSG